MRFGYWAALGVLLCGCSDEKSTKEAIGSQGVAEKSSPSQSRDQTEVQSAKLVAEFPLLPHIEKKIWHQLISEEGLGNADRVAELVVLLRKKHPFHATDQHLSLGGIRYDKLSQTIVLDAEVHYPDTGDERHPGELELILCSAEGRIHETLFVTDARPLHMEILMHLAGFKKTGEPSLFEVHILIPNHPPIGVEQMIRLENGARVGGLSWRFAGANFQPVYKPDLTGDFIICWDSSESILKVKDQKIAEGVTKLKAHRHASLKQGDKVRIRLSPVVRKKEEDIPSASP